MQKSAEKLQTPPEPEAVIITAAKWAAAGAIFWTACGVIGNAIHKNTSWKWLRTLTEGESAGIGVDAAAGAIIGGAVGFLSGSRDHAAHPIKVENVLLKNHIAELKKEKSFIQALAKEETKEPIQAEARQL